MKSKKNSAPEIDSSILENRNLKEKVTTMLDFDVLKWLRETSSAKGIGYQTLLNMILREHMDERLSEREARSKKSQESEILSEIRQVRSLLTERKTSRKRA